MGLKKAPAAKRGRKSKAEGKELEEKRRKAEEERRAANPPARTSERLKNAAAKANSREEGEDVMSQNHR